MEVCSPEALRAVAAETDDPYDREHVTPALERDPERFRHAALVNPDDLGELRWTVDHEEDLQFVRGWSSASATAATSRGWTRSWRRCGPSRRSPPSRGGAVDSSRTTA